ncbi:galactosylceramide sulfotransferase-like [Dreissena polymorpha]|uniref:Uncharacterized protein n=1 Tax=Dreissena polymorpha TaxID=45954 RepID=A0A9D3YB74_DREPO|nr:galactosylceramide sulfotransferase-like [Dreissena polymorpha]KAH3697173.1 hypothetical protein DPMN_084662 [Dreissena polymorpha]
MRRNARLIFALLLASTLALVVPVLYQRIWRLFVRVSDDDLSQLRQRSLVFIKVHKTGSSTIANILQRYGHRNELNFALPNKTVGEIRYNYFGGIGGTLDRSKMIPSKKNRPNSGFNILFNHVIYNWTAFVEIFPPNNSSYVTMIREPVSHFESALLYFVHDNIFNVATENTTAYLENPAAYEPEDAYISFTNNRQALDLGIPPRHLRNAKYAETYIKLLDKTMHLVMITEYFDESLIMLKRKFSLQLRDIIYIPKIKSTKILILNSVAMTWLC